MEDTIVVRPPMPMKKYSQNMEVTPLAYERVSQYEENHQEGHMEDTVVQNSPLSIESTTEDSLRLTSEDVSKLRQLMADVEHLRGQASFNSSWRQEAETDYISTRNRIMESQSLSSSAIATANEAGQLSLSLGSRIAWIEIDLASKDSQIGDQAVRINELLGAWNSLRDLVMAATEKTHNLEALNTGAELAAIRQRCIQMEDKIAIGNTERQTFEKNVGTTCRLESLRADEFEKRISSLEGIVKTAANQMTNLQLDVKNLNEKDRNNQQLIESLQKEVADMKRNQAMELNNDDDDISVVSSVPTIRRADIGRTEDKGEIQELEQQTDSVVQWLSKGGSERHTGAMEQGLQHSTHRFPKILYSTSSTLGGNTSTGGEPQQVKNTLQNSTYTAPFNPPKGPKKWLNQAPTHRTIPRWVSRRTTPKAKTGVRTEDKSLTTERIMKLESDIKHLKTRIERKERAQQTKCVNHPQPENNKPGSSQDSGAQWQIQRSRRREKRNGSWTTGTKVPWTKKMPGLYKMVIKAADDGSADAVGDLYWSLFEDKNNNLLLNQIATVGNMRFEYHNRKLLNHNHRGGVLLSVETPQEATRLENLGIYIHGKKHRIHFFTKAKANDICQHCSSWGHLERNCKMEGKGKCAICSRDHRTELHGFSSPTSKKGKEKLCCPNCKGGHSADSDDCTARMQANRKQLAREETLKEKAKTPKRKPVIRGATPSHGRRSRHG